MLLKLIHFIIKQYIRINYKWKVRPFSWESPKPPDLTQSIDITQTRTIHVQMDWVSYLSVTFVWDALSASMCVPPR